jgi:hypothetical protein
MFFNGLLGRSATNSITVYSPTPIGFTYDLNGNLLSDGYRTFTYDDENQLTSVVVSNGITTSTLTSNIYDGRLRRRIRRDYAWNGGWVQTTEVHYIYDGNLIIQERDARHDIPALVNARLLKPLGNFSPNSTKYFATADVLEMAKDRGWLVKVSNTICQHWQKQNARKKDHAFNGAANGHASLAAV